MAKKRRKQPDAEPDVVRNAPSIPAVATEPSVVSPVIAILSAIICVGGGLLLLALFAWAIPDAGARAKVGVQRVSDGACEGLHAEPTNPKLGAIPVAAPNFTLKDWAGSPVTLSDLRGSVVLLNFWATWCPTCVMEMASMERLTQRMKGKPFHLLAVSVDDDWDKVRKFFPKGTPLEVVLDANRSVPEDFGTKQFPESFIIDKDGTVRSYIISNRDWDTGEVQACLDSFIDG